MPDCVDIHSHTHCDYGHNYSDSDLYSDWDYLDVVRILAEYHGDNHGHTYVDPNHFDRSTLASKSIMLHSRNARRVLIVTDKLQ